MDCQQADSLFLAELILNQKKRHIHLVFVCKVKTKQSCFLILDREEQLKKIRGIKNEVKGDLPNVYLLHGDLTDVEMNELYNHPRVKAHISLTHGEGFGLPIFEAAYSGLPVVAPAWSGHVDFLYAPVTNPKSKK